MSAEVWARSGLCRTSKLKERLNFLHKASRCQVTTVLVTRIKTAENKTTYYIWNEKTEQQTEDVFVTEIGMILSLEVGKKKTTQKCKPKRNPCKPKYYRVRWNSRSCAWLLKENERMYIQNSKEKSERKVYYGLKIQIGTLFVHNIL